jgi:hypothetical protein
MNMERTMRTVLALVLGSCLVTRPVLGQLAIGADVRLGFYGGASRDTTTDSFGAGFRPYRPVLYTLRPEWRGGRIGVVLGLTYGQPDIAEEGEPVSIVVHLPTRLLEVAPEISMEVWRSSAGMRIRVHAGPIMDLWQLPGEDGLRSRPGGHGALSAEFPVLGKVQAVLRADLVLTGALWTDADLPPGFEIQNMHRFGFGLGLRYGR